ncbi:MAG: hypothetical protein KF696_14130 [Planctomycetes bacterium]|nr:hypothetical protein [Planctomycetota bacterium]MCW8136867.1 hypothetical protein [Planctomycetota bacterium]
MDEQNQKGVHFLDRAVVRVPIELAMRWCALWWTIFGWRWAYFWARWAARIGWLLMPKVRGYSLRNVDLCLHDLSRAERTRIAKLGLRHSVYQFVDYLLIPRYFKPGSESPYFHTDVDAREFLDWYNQPRAVFNLTAHIGNFEIVTFNIGRTESHAPLTLIAKPVRPPLLDRWLVRARAALGNECVKADEGGRAYMRAIKDKRQVGTLVDQNGGDFAPVETFFGVPCTWQADFTRLVLRAGGDVCFHFCVRDGDRFAFRYLPPEMHTYAPGTDPMQIVRDYRDALERVVRQYPEQYFWVHRRFKGRKKKWPDRYANLGKRLTPEQRQELVSVPVREKDRAL